MVLLQQSPVKKSFRALAPTRVDLAGGTLDIWPLYCFISGAKTINLAIDACAIAEFEISDSTEFQISLSDDAGSRVTWEASTPAAIPPSLAFPYEIISHYLSQAKERPAVSVQLRVSTQAPRGSGLGGSSSLCVAIRSGLMRLFDEDLGPDWKWRILTWCRDLEAKHLNAPTGTQDYLAALFGGLHAFDSQIGFLEKHDFPDSHFQQLMNRSLVIYSGEQHNSGLSNWDKIKKVVGKEAGALQGLLELKDIAEKVFRVLEQASPDWTKLGRLMSEEWKIRKSVFSVSTPRLEEILDFLKSLQVLGAKVCGAAQGGSLLVLLEPGEREKIATACRRLGITVLTAGGNTQGVRFEGTA